MDCISYKYRNSSLLYATLTEFMCTNMYIKQYFMLKYITYGPHMHCFHNIHIKS